MTVLIFPVLDKADYGSTVRNNLMHEPYYSPYCGGDPKGCSWPRTFFNGSQFECEECKWKSSLPEKFIEEYKEKWNIK